MIQTTTLTDYIRHEEKKYSGASGHFTNILLSIALASKIVSRGVNRAGLANMLGLAGHTNVQGEEVQKLDEYADNAFSSVLSRTGEFSAMVSEEQDDVVIAEEGTAKSDYVIVYDPLDGSSNIDTNISIGTIWAVYRRVRTSQEPCSKDKRDFLRPGREIIASGYALYGSSTMFVITTGRGVDGFTLDPTVGEFMLTHPELRIPDEGPIYSCNQANYSQWPAGVKNYVDSIKQNSAATSRYVGSMVADVHRTLLKGGIFFYPEDANNPDGKLRLLYECAPLARIMEQAGGMASDGRQSILDIVPSEIHQRTPLYIGSPKNVESLLAYLK